MRLGDFLDRFQVAAAIGKGEGLPCAVRAFCRDSHHLCGPAMAALHANAPARRDAIFEHFEGKHTVSGVDAACVRARAMVMTVPLQLQALLLPPGAPQHPDSNADDQGSGCDLKIRLRRSGVPCAAETRSDQGGGPHDEGMRGRGGQSEQDRLRHGAAHRSSPGMPNKSCLEGNYCGQRAIVYCRNLPPDSVARTN
jgi:hypothetical protein